MYVSSNHLDLPVALRFISVTYNSAHQERNGLSPFNLLCGRKPAILIVFLLPFLLESVLAEFPWDIVCPAEDTWQLVHLRTLDSPERRPVAQPCNVLCLRRCSDMNPFKTCGRRWDAAFLTRCASCAAYPFPSNNSPFIGIKTPSASTIFSCANICLFLVSSQNDDGLHVSEKSKVFIPVDVKVTTDFCFSWGHSAYPML